MTGEFWRLPRLRMSHSGHGLTSVLRSIPYSDLRDIGIWLCMEQYGIVRRPVVISSSFVPGCNITISGIPH